MVKICNHCRQEYSTKDKRQKYCGVECSRKARKKNKTKVKCDCCGKELKRYPSQILEKVFCSRKCSVDYNKNNHNKKLVCSICGKEFKRMKSAIKGRKRHYCSYKCSNIGWGEHYSGDKHHSYTSVTVECSYCGSELVRKHCRANSNKYFFCNSGCQGNWMSENNRGENNPLYNPYLTDEDRVTNRNTEDYNEWRLSVYRRDKFTCQICGDKNSRLNAHHLNAYARYSEDRTNVDNGVTLCESCHRNYHSIHGRGNNTKEEFESYIERIEKAL